jgi:hypothetical protein
MVKISNSVARKEKQVRPPPPDHAEVLQDHLKDRYGNKKRHGPWPVPVFHIPA